MDEQEIGRLLVPEVSQVVANMGFWSDSWLLELITWTVIFTSTLYIYFQWAWTYWKRRGVPQLQPRFPFGSFTDIVLMKKQMGLAFQDVYKAMEGERFVGTYMLTRPGVLLRDPELVKACLVKDFSHFHDRGFYDASDRDPLLHHLFILKGKEWRNLRATLSPTFTSGKLKMMFPTLLECSLDFRDYLQKSADNGEVLEMKDLVARLTTDIIASCALGVKCNCVRNPNAEFRQWGRKFMETNFQTSIFLILTTLAPKLLDYIRVSPVDKKVSKYFIDMVAETVRYREENNVSRNDFMQLLIQLKNKGFVDVDREREETTDTGLQIKGECNKLHMNDLAAQAFVFYIAGFETSSTTITFCLYELAVNEEIQRRVQREIDAVLNKYKGQITYESLQEMTYLDKVIAETLRKYPTLAFLNREVTKSYRVPNTKAVLEEGTAVVIPVYALHHDPKYYPDPERFDPERFNEEQKAKRHNAVYLPFGEGPRICIGMRFGSLQTKMGIFAVLSRYNVHLSNKTQVPPVFDPNAFVTLPLGGMWLKITNRNL